MVQKCESPEAVELAGLSEGDEVPGKTGGAVEGLLQLDEKMPQRKTCWGGGGKCRFVSCLEFFSSVPQIQRQ